MSGQIDLEPIAVSAYAAKLFKGGHTFGEVLAELQEQFPAMSEEKLKARIEKAHKGIYVQPATPSTLSVVIDAHELYYKEIPEQDGSAAARHERLVVVSDQHHGAESQVFPARLAR